MAQTLYIGLVFRCAVYFSYSFSQILLVSNLLLETVKIQPEGRDEDLDHTRFSESAMKSFEYIIHPESPYCWNVLVCYFTVWKAHCMKFTSCFNMRNVCYNHIFITIFYFTCFTIWWLDMLKENIPPLLVSFVILLLLYLLVLKKEKRGTLVWPSTWLLTFILYIIFLKTTQKKKNPPKVETFSVTSSHT